MTTASSRDRASQGGDARPGPAAGRDRASWRESAACRQADPELFFPIGSAGIALAEIRRAKTVCAGSPQQQPPTDEPSARRPVRASGREPAACGALPRLGQ